MGTIARVKIHKNRAGNLVNITMDKNALRLGQNRSAKQKSKGGFRPHLFN
jgi:hypothetical protein